MRWFPRVNAVRHSITLVKGVAVAVLAEQGIEVLIFSVHLAEHPLLVIAALGALGFPVPGKEEPPS